MLMKLLLYFSEFAGFYSTFNSLRNQSSVTIPARTCHAFNFVTDVTDQVVADVEPLKTF